MTDRKFKIILYTPIVMTIFIFIIIGVMLISNNETALEKEQNELKKTFDRCEDRDDYDYCIKETTVNGVYEKRERRFYYE